MWQGGLMGDHVRGSHATDWGVDHYWPWHGGGGMVALGARACTAAEEQVEHSTEVARWEPAWAALDVLRTRMYRKGKGVTQ